MTPATLYIRADASAGMGIGHVMRCLALSQAWQDRGGRVSLISWNLDPKLIQKLRARDIHLFPVDSAWPDPKDLVQTLACLGPAHTGPPPQPAWVVVDGYHFDQTFAAGLKSAGHKVLFIDDFNHRKAYQADILVNQNLWGKRYPYQVPKGCKVLTGSRYVMLRKEFSSPPCPQRSKAGNLNVLVTMGGADPSRLTPRILRALMSLNRTDLDIKIALGPAATHRALIEAALPTDTMTIEILSDPDMAAIMAWAHLALTAAGSTCWELCAMGVPFMVFPVADNQTDIAKSLEHRINAVNAGPPDLLSPKEMTRLIDGFLKDKQGQASISRKGRQLVDGYGARRIVQEMAGHGDNNLALPPLMTITIVSDKDSWLNAFLPKLVSGCEQLGHRVNWCHDLTEIMPSDMAFYLSLGQIVPPDILKGNTHNLVVHGSALPHGRGWSPISWQVLEGKNNIPLTLFEASDKVDTGPVYLQETIRLKGTELIQDIRKATAALTIEMCMEFLKDYQGLVPAARMPRGKGSIYPRRRPSDSQLDPDMSIADQFNLLRIVDNENYPAFFTLRGRRYKLVITPMGEQPNED